MEWAVDDLDEGTTDHDRATPAHDGDESMSAIAHDVVVDDDKDMEAGGIAVIFMRFARNSAATESLASCFLASSSLCSGFIRSANQGPGCRHVSTLTITATGQQSTH